MSGPDNETREETEAGVGVMHARESVDLEGAKKWIAFLDALALAEPKAMGALVNHRVPCGHAFANHPTTQVSAPGEDLGQGEPPSGDHLVGFVGILNGFLGADEEGWGPVAAIMEPDGRCAGFRLSRAWMDSDR